MSSEIQSRAVSGVQLYAVLRQRSTGLVWNVFSSIFEAPVSGNWNLYVVGLSEGPGTGLYVADFPVGITVSGVYTAVIYIQLGGGCVPTDTFVSEMDIEWNGHALTTSLNNATLYSSGMIYMANGGSSSAFPGIDGTVINPLAPGEWANALTLLSDLQLNTLYLNSPVVVSALSAIPAIRITGPAARTSFFNLNSQNFNISQETPIENLVVFGTSGNAGGNFENCYLGGYGYLTFAPFSVNNCVIGHVIFNGIPSTPLRNIYFDTINRDGVLDFSYIAGTFIIDGWNGSGNIASLTNGATLTVSGTGEITVLSSCNGGTLRYIGDINIIDQSGSVSFVNLNPNYIEIAYPDGAIYVNSDSGTTGTVLGVHGTSGNPVNNQADAEALCSNSKLTTIKVYGSLTFNQTPQALHYLGVADDWDWPKSSINLNGQLINAFTVFERIYMEGTATGSSNGVFINCSCDGLSAAPVGWDGGSIAWLQLSSNVYSTWKNIVLDGPFDGGGIDFNNLSGNINFANLSGQGTFLGITSGMTINMYGDADISINGNGGTVNYIGNFKITDLSGGTVQIHNIDPNSIQKAYPDGQIYVDTISGNSGINVGINGTISNPVNNCVDAYALLNATGIKKIFINPGSALILSASPIGSITITSDSGMFASELDLNGFALGNSTVSNLLVMSSQSIVNCGGVFVNCFLVGGAFTPAMVIDSVLNAVTINDNNVAVCRNCSAWNSATFDFNNVISSQYFTGWSGDLSIYNMPESSNLEIYGQGQITLTSSCSGGVITYSGDIIVTDNSTGTLLVNVTPGGLSKSYPDGMIHYDDTIDIGHSGQVPGFNGTMSYPVNNFADAMALLAKTNIDTLYLHDGATLSLFSDPGYILIKGAAGLNSIVALEGATTISSSFENIRYGDIYGEQPPSSVSGQFTNCIIGAASGVTMMDLSYANGGSLGHIMLNSNQNVTLENMSNWLQTETSINMNSTLSRVQMNNWSGDLIIYNMDSDSVFNIYGSGTVTIDSSCTGGIVEYSGDIKIITNSASVAITNFNSISQSYPDGMIYFDNNTGTAGVNVGFNGTASNPVNNYADLISLLTATKLRKVFMNPWTGVTITTNPGYIAFIGTPSQLAQSSVTLSTDTIFASFENLVIETDSTVSTQIMEFVNCFFSNATLSPGMCNKGVIGKITLNSSSECTYSGMRSDVWWNSTAQFDYAGFAASAVFLDWSGDLTIYNLAPGALLKVYGSGTVNIHASCTGGTIRYAGDIQIIGDSGSLNNMDLQNLNPNYLQESYPDNSIHYANYSGGPGAIPGINGTISNTCNNMADATALCNILNIYNIYCGVESNVTAIDNMSYISFTSNNVWFLDIHGASLYQSVFEYASVTCSVACESYTYSIFKNCLINCLEAFSPTNVVGGWLINVKLPAATGGTWTGVSSFTETPAVFDFNGVVDTALFADWSGDIIVKNMPTSAVFNIYGNGTVTLDSSCAGGTLNYNGEIFVTDHSDGDVTIHHLNAGVIVSGYSSGQDPVTLIKADSDFSQLIANTNGHFIFTPPDTYPGTGTLVLKDKTGEDTLLTLILGFDASKTVISRTSS